MFFNLLIYIAGGAALGIAWTVPDTHISAILGFVSVILLILPFYRSDRGLYLGSFLYGMVSHSIAFQYIIDTIKFFGGYNNTFSLVIFGAFLITHAFAFPVFVFFQKQLKGTMVEKTALAGFFAWVTTLLSTVRVFPWHYGHTLSSVTPLTQIAEIGGVLLISFVMFYIAESLVRYTFNLTSRSNLILACICLALTFLFGTLRINYYNNLDEKKIKVSMIQADIGIFEKNNVKYIETNTQKYWELSQKAAREYQPDLIVWPESAIITPVPDKISYIDDKSPLPYIPDTNFNIGALTQDQGNLYNSSFSIRADRKVEPAYHKQILMPFGEYMPFADVYPELKRLNPNLASFTKGTQILVHYLGNGLRIANLICYEDLVPELSRIASKNDATILINLTNDAWFGNSAAPHQHNLIASFRTIENRKYLLRSTNSGLTAIISPLGKTIAQLPVFSENVLNHEVGLLDKPTFYNKFFSTKIWWLICLYVVILSIVRLLKKRAKE